MLCLMLVVFFLDSTWLAIRFSYGQWIANVVTLLYFLWMYQNANKRIKQTMKYAVVIATVGEVFLCLVLGMYEYRLENVPIYVPLGHAILYTTVWYLTHDPWVIKQQTMLMRLMLGFIIIYTFALLILDNDTYGAICSLLLLILLALNPKSRRFFLIMFIAVAYLEQLGTYFECWYWQPTVLNNPNWISSGNPPSGISLGYYILDVLCLGVYLFRHRLLNKRWKKRTIKTHI